MDDLEEKCRSIYGWNDEEKGEHTLLDFMKKSDANRYQHYDLRVLSNNEMLTSNAGNKLVLDLSYDHLLVLDLFKITKSGMFSMSTEAHTGTVILKCKILEENKKTGCYLMNPKTEGNNDNAYKEIAEYMKGSAEIKKVFSDAKVNPINEGEKGPGTD